MAANYSERNTVKDIDSQRDLFPPFHYGIELPIETHCVGLMHSIPT